MTRRFCLVLILTLAGGPLRAATTNAVPDFQEVYELLRAHLPGATDESLNRAAIEGLLSRFPGQVSLTGDATNGSAVSLVGPALSESLVLESNVAYLRVSRVAAGLADELGAAQHALAGTNKIAGVVLDLRFADGDQYAAVPATEKLFGAKEFAARPFVVLVNGETRGAAEALAAGLRQTGAGLIIGNLTAGPALAFKEFALSNGERLRIAAAPPVSWAGPAVPTNGIQTDIAVTVNADDERAFFENPYGPVAVADSHPVAATNVFLPFVDHTSEADLVRHKQKDGGFIGAPGLRKAGADSVPQTNDGGEGDEDALPADGAGPQMRVIRDPALARAVDLVKGLAIVRQSRP